MRHRGPSAVMAAVAIGTVLGERLLAAVRLLAHEHVSAETDAGRNVGDIGASRDC